MESSEEVEEERPSKIAEALGVTPEAILNFNEEVLFNNINNTFHDQSALVNYQFNPIDKIVELYERLLNSEREKVELLQSLRKKENSGTYTSILVSMASLQITMNQNRNKCISAFGKHNQATYLLPKSEGLKYRIMPFALRCTFHLR